MDTQWFISFSYSTPYRSGFGNLSVIVELEPGETTLTFKTIQSLEEQISKECYNGVGKVVIMNFIRIEG